MALTVDKKRKLQEIQEKIESDSSVLIKCEDSKSSVWMCFCKIDGYNDYVHCKFYKKILSYRNITTSNLLHHPCYKKIKQDKIKITAAEKKSLGNAVTYWVARNLVPFNIVSGDGFKLVSAELIKIGDTYNKQEIDIDYMLPDRNTISSNVPKLYNHYFNDIKSEIAKVKYGAITTDMWSDSHKKLAYMGVTLHYVFAGKIVNRVLAVKHFDSDRQTGPNLHAKLKDICESYSISMEDFQFVTDRGTNIIAALAKYNRITCAAHIINNALNSAAKDSKSPLFSDFLIKCKALARYFKKSTNLQSKLKTPLKSGCETRWNSNLAIFLSIKTNYNDICQILTSKNELSEIQDISLAQLEEIIDFLKVFNEAAEEMQRADIPSLYLVFPYFYDLKNHCQLRNSESDMLKIYKTNVGKLITENWKKEIKMPHYAATFLFPSCKKLLMLSDEKK